MAQIGASTWTAAAGGRAWDLVGSALKLRVEVGGDGVPALCRLVCPGLGPADWGAGGCLGPVVAVGDEVWAPGAGLPFVEGRIEGGARQLELLFAGPDGLEVQHCLEASDGGPAWRSWTEIRNTGTGTIADIRRFDAAGFGIGVSSHQPWVAYVLGWLDGPRAEAPGRPPVPFPYPSWIPRLLYGDGAPPPPPPPEGGWALPPLRVVCERLTRLPLRSGKRSTYDNHPWVVVRDVEREGGLFAGLEWSGQWRLDVEHTPARRQVCLAAGTGGNRHELQPGASLTSPAAFVGWYGGDWDDASNASRRYVGGQLMPERLPDFPAANYNIGSPTLPRFAGSLLREEIDAAAELGFDRFEIDAMWWAGSPGQGDFSIGLGRFEDCRRRFPEGLQAVSQYVRQKGMKFGLWFEFERVDIRTANQGPRPWSPAWLTHQNGHPYRSWCQHVFLLCLGVPEAAAWALENVSWAIREYGVEWMKIDANEWAVCDDASHGHGAGDGDWAHTQGLYRVLAGLRERFPDLIIENCAGGSQRADPGMARYCRVMHCHDIHYPSAYNRRQGIGVGTMYPCTYSLRPLYKYPGEAAPQRLEWRILNRLMGSFQSRLELTSLSAVEREIFRRCLATYKRLRPSLHGDRYILSGPPVICEPERREADQWEAYQFLAPDRRLTSAFFYRCDSPEAEHRARLRGLDPAARYRVEYHSGQSGGELAGSDLMEEGLTCRLDALRSADVALLTPIPA